MSGNGGNSITNVPASGSLNVAPECEGCSLVVISSHLDATDKDIELDYGTER